MIKAPQDYTIYEEYDFYRQQAYRRYTKGGVEGVIAFLTELLSVNIFLARILKRQYREFMSDDQSQQFNDTYEEALGNYRSLETAYSLALYTAAALSSRSRKAPAIVKESAYRCAEDKDFTKAYNKAFHEINQLAFLTPTDYVQFILYKYLNYNRRLRYNDLFENTTPIILKPYRHNNPLKLLFAAAIKDKEFKYLWYLTRILPNATMEMAAVNEEDIFNAGKDLTSNQYAHYINFCIRMFLRTDENTSFQLKSLNYCCERLSQTLAESKPEELPFIKLLQLLYSLTLDYQNSSEYIEKYQYEPIDPKDMVNEHLRDLTDHIFDLLFQHNPGLVLSFINKLKDNNPYYYREARDYNYAFRRANSVLEQWLEVLNIHYEKTEIRDIYMNSILRSCYPLSLFLNKLFASENAKRADLVSFMKDYRFVGHITKKKKSDYYEIISYSFRNEFCLITIDVSHLKKNKTLVSEFINNSRLKTYKSVRFILQSLYINNNASDSFVHFSVLLAHDWQVKDFTETRKYKTYINEDR